VFHKTIIALTAAAALSLPVATSAFAADHPGGGHATAGHATAGHATGGHARGGYARGGHGARYGGGYYYGGGGPVYDSCDGYYGPGSGCEGYGVPIVGGLINGVLGGY
jgi:hypothetical protein